jgi:hypothetical protein
MRRVKCINARLKEMYLRLREMNEPSASLLLLLLLSADFVFITLLIINMTLVPNSLLCNTYGLCTYLKSYHLVKLFWVIILLAYVLKSTRCSGYMAWILVFTYDLFDDAFNIHQYLGGHIANSFYAYNSNNLGLQPRLFELAVLGLAGIFLLAIVAWAYFRSPYEFRKVSNDLLLFIVALVFFGVIADLATTIKLGPVIIYGLGIVEDGGEIIIVSLILWYVFLLAIHNGK